MKYLSYRRVSKREKSTGSISLDWQAAEIKRWCERNKVAEIQDFADDGVSAKKPLTRRDQGKELIAAAKVGPATVVCAHMDRIFRSSREFQNQIYEWASKGVLFVAVNGGTDLTTPEGRCFATCMAAFHQLEREKVSERAISRGKQRKQMGLRHSSAPPFGFRYADEGVGKDGGKTGGRPVRDEEQQAVIAKMQKWRDNGDSLREIAAKLDAAGVKPRRGKKWRHTTVKFILETAKPRLSKRNRGERGETIVPDLTIHKPLQEKEGEE